MSKRNSKSRRLKPTYNPPSKSADHLPALAEAYFAALIVISQVEGTPTKAQTYIDSAREVLAVTLADIQAKYFQATNQSLPLSHVEASFSTPAESDPDEQATYTQD